MRNRRPTLVELEALRATIANGTTAGAAQRLGCSQSSVSAPWPCWRRGWACRCSSGPDA